MLDTKKAPGTDARSEQPADPDRPDEIEQDGEPEGTPPDGGQGDGKSGQPAPKEQPGKPDAAAGGKEKAPEATEQDWKAKYEDAEQKRRDTQSKLDKAANGSKEHEGALRTLDAGWRGWIERNAPDAYAKLQAFEQKQGETRSGEQSVRAQSDRVINGVYREGEKAFGDYLTDLVDSGARITPQSLERHRATFDKYAGNGHANGNGAAPAAKPAAAAPPGPPRVAGGGRPSVEAPPAWKPGDPINSRKYLTEGLAKGDARGKQSRRSMAESR